MEYRLQPGVIRRDATRQRLFVVLEQRGDALQHSLNAHVQHIQLRELFRRQRSHGRLPTRGECNGLGVKAERTQRYKPAMLSQRIGEHSHGQALPRKASGELLELPGVIFQALPPDTPSAPLQAPRPLGRERAPGADMCQRGWRRHLPELPRGRHRVVRTTPVRHCLAKGGNRQPQLSAFASGDSVAVSVAVSGGASAAGSASPLASRPTNLTPHS